MSGAQSISRAAMRDLDRRAQEEFGVPGAVLMENAGREVATAVLQRLRAYKVSQAVRQGLAARANDEDVPRTLDELEAWKASLKRVDGPVGIVCGPGNNGGDGYVAARTLVNHGVQVVTVAVGGSPEDLAGDALGAWRALSLLGEGAMCVRDAAGIAGAASNLRSCHVIVDALFGTGLSRPLDGVYKSMVETLNGMDLPTIAVDIPSGLDCDTGEILGSAVLADLTITFGALKHGMLRQHGPDYCGTVQVSEIGLPACLIAEALARK